MMCILKSKAFLVIHRAKTTLVAKYFLKLSFSKIPHISVVQSKDKWVHVWIKTCRASKLCINIQGILKYQNSLDFHCLSIHRRQPTRLPRTWDSPGKNTGVGCHFLLQAKELGMAKNKVKYYLINLCFQNEIIFSRSLFGSYKLVPKKITSIS